MVLLLMSIGLPMICTSDAAETEEVVCAMSAERAESPHGPREEEDALIRAWLRRFAGKTGAGVTASGSWGTWCSTEALDRDRAMGTLSFSRSLSTFSGKVTEAERDTRLDFRRGCCPLALEPESLEAFDDLLSGAAS
mmetsp:Transcript_43593/g.102766  ORF Transcript_43593/g.102766 Transcript_43593/m.102766 type:complete len:137 (-) Transcript_43593:999-1409(-)